MSGLRASVTASAASSFLIFCSARCAGRKSDDGSGLHHDVGGLGQRHDRVAHLDRGLDVVDASRRRDRRRNVGAATRSTGAPRRAAAAAIAYPIFPVERLPMNRTGSSGSRVPPGGHDHVQPCQVPRRAPRRPRSRRGSPAPPPAAPAPRPRRPAGPRRGRPRSRRARPASRRWPAWPGAATSRCASPGPARAGRSGTARSSCSRSSPRPCASLASTLAVAGAITATSASRARRTCTMRWASVKTPAGTGRPVSPSNVAGPTISAAAAVRTACTVAPALRSPRASDAALYAAMPPDTPSRTWRPSSGRELTTSGVGRLDVDVVHAVVEDRGLALDRRAARAALPARGSGSCTTILPSAISSRAIDSGLLESTWSTSGRTYWPRPSPREW